LLGTFGTFGTLYINQVLTKSKLGTFYGTFGTLLK
jgi:hypothetical protein